MRYIAGTNILKSLQQSGEKIVMFVKDDEVSHFEKVFADDNVTIEPVLFSSAQKQMKQSKMVSALNLLRIMTAGKTDTTRNHTIEFSKLQYSSEFRSMKGKILFTLIKLMSALTCNFYVARRFLIFVLSLRLNGQIYDEYFVKYKPHTLLISSIGYGVDIAFMNSARRNQCKIISIPHSWDNSSTKGYRGVRPDRVVTWNYNMAKEIEIFHDIPKDHIYTGGIAHWDTYFTQKNLFYDRKDFFRKHMLDGKRKLLFYALSAPKHFEQRSDVIQGILNAIKSNNIHPNSQLLVRFHPQHLMQHGTQVSLGQEYQSLINQLQIEYGDCVKFWIPKVPHLNEATSLAMTDMFEMAEGIANCDIVVQEYSTLILEAAVFDKPVINISMYNWKQGLPSDTFELFTHLRHIVSYQSFKTARTFQEFIRIANDYLENPETDAANRRLLREQETDINKGHAGHSIGEYVLDFITENRNFKLQTKI
tara:strand:+ start:2790 stop:4220 length:1431 start_codon:yes stop_codon:yes gene_type:complete